MADGTALNAGSGGDTIATDDVTDLGVANGQKVQRIKVGFGADNAYTDVESVSTNPLPVALSATDNAVLDSIDAAVNGTVTVDGSGVTQPVSGTVTANLGATDNAVLDSIDAAVNGTLTVGSHAVTNAGTFAVQVSASVPGTGATNLGKAVDSAAGATDTGVALLAVRDDALTTLTPVDGDYTPLRVGSTGSLHVTVDTITGSQTDDAAFTPGTSIVSMVGAEFDDTTPDSVDEGDGGALRMSANRNLYATLRDAAGNERGLNVDASGRIGITIEADNVGIGGGTQYTEDAAAAADPVGNAVILVRKDTPAATVTTDGDNVAQRGTDYGAGYVTILTSSGTPVDSFGGSGGTAMTDDGVFTAATTSVTPIGGFFNDSTPDSVDEGDGGAVRMSANRNLYSTIRDAAGNERGVNVNASNQLSVSVDNTVTVGSHAVTNAGTFATQVDGAALTALQVIDNPVIVDDAAFTPATTSVMVAGFTADETATDSVDEGDAGAARMTLDRKQIVTPYVHAAAGGWTPYKNLDVDETEDEIKSTAGKIGWIHCMNMTASVVYLKLYNATAASVVVGTTTPVHTFPVPTLGDTNGAGFNIAFGDAGLQFSTAICVAATTGLADNDTGAPAANAVVFNCGYL